MHLVVGLGNPGVRYSGTRHNAGFLVVDRIARRLDASVTKRQFGSLVASVSMSGQPAVLVMPQTFMNLSGQAVASVRGFYKAPAEAIVVVHDEVDLPFGQVRIKKGGGHGGHNGLRDIQKCLGTNEFIRVRVGVSRPPKGWDTADYVLGKWSAEEHVDLDSVIDTAANAVESVVTQGVARAMESVNARKPQRHAIESSSNQIKV